MDFALYFTIREEELHDGEEPDYNSAQLGDAHNRSGLPTGCVEICLEDNLTEYIANLESRQRRTHMDEQLMKPLPPIPEEPRPDSQSIFGKEDMTIQLDNTDRSQSEPSRGPTTTHEPCLTPLQRRARAARKPSTTTVKRVPSMDAIVEHPYPMPTDKNLSLWPKPHACDVHQSHRISTNVLQHHRYIDSKSANDFDSLHSKESCDLDRWASEVYGPHESAMTSLRNKRRDISPRQASTDSSQETVSTTNKHQVSMSYQDSAYCSSTSASIHTDRDRNSSTSMSDLLAEYTDQWRSQDTETASFFDPYDDDEKSTRTSQKALPAKKLWRKMAISLRTAKERLPGPPTRTSGMPPVDVPMILT